MTTDLSKRSIEQLVDLINLSNEGNDAELMSNEINFEWVEVEPTGDKNTVIRLVSKPNTKYTGDVVVEYNRLELEGFETNYGVTFFNVLENATLSDVVNAFNSHYGSLLELNVDLDATVEFTPVSYTPAVVDFIAKSDSYAYVGGIEVSYGMATSPLSTIIPNTIIGSLRFPIPPGALLDGTLVGNRLVGTARGSHAVAIVDDKIYAVGGRNSGGTLLTTGIYNITTNLWSSGANMGFARVEHRCNAVNGKLYVFGGTTDTRMSIYTISSNTWQNIAVTGPVPRYGLKSVVIGDYIYYHGGRNNSGDFTGELWRYDTVNNVWLALASSPVVMSSHSLAHVEGKLYAYGGSAGQINQYVGTSIFYVYDIAANQWSQLPNSPYARATHSATVVRGRIYYYGGTIDSSAGGHVSTLLVYTPEYGEWLSLGNVGTTRRDIMTVNYNDHLISYGGVLANTYNGSVLEIQ